MFKETRLKKAGGWEHSTPQLINPIPAGGNIIDTIRPQA
jgi:hypothetical protein